jgi:hypothetical protein
VLQANKPTLDRPINTKAGIGSDRRLSYKDRSQTSLLPHAALVPTYCTINVSFAVWLKFVDPDVKVPVTARL